MKPGIIFSAVFAVSFLMIGLLPRIGQATVASAPAFIEPTQVVPLPIVTVGAPASNNLEQVAGQPVEPSEGEETTAAPEGTAPEGPVQIDEAGASALPDTADEEFKNFVRTVSNGQVGSVTGIFVPGLFGMPVTGQPAGNENYISEDENVLTQYTTPAQYGVIAILAHNFLSSGKLLSRLSPNQEVYIVYGDGKVSRYQVSAVQYFQAISPHDTRSDFRDLNGPGGEVISYDQLFNRVYTKSAQLVFQTCLEANGDLSWGRIFISAEPAG